MSQRLPFRYLLTRWTPFVLLLSTSCQSPSLSVRTTTPARVFELTATSTSTTVSKDLGPAPVTTKLDSVGEKPLLIRFDTLDTLVMNSGCGRGGDVTLTLDSSALSALLAGKNDAKSPADTGRGQSAVKRRSFDRLLMRAMKDLYEGQYESARTLALEASKEDPSAAAPHVISGLTFYQQGKRSEARSAFVRAKAIDPEDGELDILLKQVGAP